MSITRGRPRPASRTAPTCSGMIRRSSSSAAVIAETVVVLNSVNWEISTRDTGPNRRIASITWKRLIARINSGSAVFIARERSASAFSAGDGINFIPAAGCQPHRLSSRQDFSRPPLDSAARVATDLIRIADKSNNVRALNSPGGDNEFSASRIRSRLPGRLDGAGLRRHQRHRSSRQRKRRPRRRCGTRSRPTTTPQHKGVKVQFKYLENEAFKAKLPTMLQSDDRPDLFYSWAGGVMQAQDKAGLPQGHHRRRGLRRVDDVSHRGRRLQGRRQGRRRAVRSGRGRLLLQQEAVREGRREGRGHQELGRFPRRGEEAQGGRHHPDRRRRRREVADALLLLLSRHAHRRRPRARRREGRKGRRLQERDLRRGRQAPARARRARAVPARLSLDQARASRPACSATARRRWT